ncbi:Transient receptor putative cation channel sub V member 4, partial [Modicella reniformis]
KEEHKDKLYQVKTGIHRESLRDGDGSMYWVLRVEVVERDSMQDPIGKVIFSFVPEPWMRVSTANARQPAKLQSVYFLPKGNRFVVAGMQTLQVWSFPTENNRDFSLDFIWSRPRAEEDPPDGKVYNSEPVGQYYQPLRSIRIYQDFQNNAAASTTTPNNTAVAAADIGLMNGQEDSISIPTEHSWISNRSLSTYCMRSIHLLAAAYAYSSQHTKTSRHAPQLTFTFEEHAKAIARFTLGHINRLLSAKDFYPRQPTAPGNLKQTPGPTSGQTPVATPVAESFTFSHSTPSRTHSNSSQLRNAWTYLNGKGKENPYDQSNQSTTTVSKPKKSGVPPNTDNKILIIDVNKSRTRKNPTQKNIFKRLIESHKGPRNCEEKCPKVVTVLTLLLNQLDLKEANHIFIEGLLDTADHEWIPHADRALNPIYLAIGHRHGDLVEIIISYCIKNAKALHPAYLMPAVQCLNALSRGYPDILRDLFRKASYVPAHNPEYVVEHAILANLRFTDWITFFAHYFSFGFFKGKLFRKTKSTNINHYQKPVFSLRSQLPMQSSKLMELCHIDAALHRRRKVEFPEPRKAVMSSNNADEKFSHKIYVAPFPKMSSYGRYRSSIAKYNVESAFTILSGDAFFDSPAMQATLAFKWHKFGLLHWVMPFLITLTFFVCMMIVTAFQIIASSPFEDNRKPTDEEIAKRYLPDKRWFFIVTIVVGSILILIDLRRILISFKVVKYKHGTMHEDTNIDGGPSQIWYMSFGILALYLNMLFELRVFRPFGVPVYIILKIMWKVRWFFMILALFVISFTHALLHLLHTRSYDPCTNNKCVKLDYPDKYPKNFFAALGVTTFFLAGRFEPLSDSLDKGSPSFNMMMIIFFVFTALLITNILIAWMGHAFTQCKQEGREAWHRQWSDVIADVEVNFLSNNSRYNRNNFPDYIYYGANQKAAEQYESTYLQIGSKSNLSLENQFILEKLDQRHN